MAHYGNDHRVRIDEHEHLLHGRVCISDEGDEGENDGVCMTSPLPFAQLKLMHGSRTIGTTQTRADGSYTMLFTMKAAPATKKRSKRRHSPDVRLHIFNDKSDSCKSVNISKRCSFATELVDVMSADCGVQDGLIWEQSLEIDFRDVFPGSSVASTFSAQNHSYQPTLMETFQDLQAHELCAAVQELAEDMNEADEDAEFYDELPPDLFHPTIHRGYEYQ